MFRKCSWPILLGGPWGLEPPVTDPEQIGGPDSCSSGGEEVAGSELKAVVKREIRGCEGLGDARIRC